MSTPTTRRAPALASVLVLVLLSLAGCVSIPTSGPIQKVEGQQPACQNCVNVEVAPPASGDDPVQVVKGFLLANANYQPGYKVAKQYLTRAAAQTWNPDASVTIYTGLPVPVGRSVALVGQQVGLLLPDRTFLARNQKLRQDLELKQEDGEWRINAPPPGLLVAAFSFNSFYQPYDLFFVGSSGSLVPDSVYLPDLRNPANFASALVKGLLGGPSKWLVPAVSTAVPQGTQLSVDSVTITDGVAQVPLSNQVLALSDEQRTLLAAQLVYTLKQLSVVKKVQLLVDSQPFRVPASEAGDFAVPIEAVSPALDPVPFVPVEQLYAVRKGKLQRLDANSGSPQAEPLPGALGRARYRVDSVAVAADDGEVALVTDDQTVLRRGATTTGDVRTVPLGATGLLRPQLTRGGELWAVGERGGRQQMWVVGSDGTQTSVRSPVLDRGRVTAFRISPDGTRMALLVRRGGRTELGRALILRSDTVTVSSWRALDTQTLLDPAITDMGDLAWTDATNLMVLAATGTTGPLVPTLISEDASRAVPDREVQSNDWDAVEVTVLLRTKTAVVRARDGRTFRDDGTAWRLFLPGVTAVAYPG